MANCKPGELNFVALVGGPGSGKTILAKAHCHQTGGDFIDADLYAWWPSASHARKVGPAIYLDRPAKTPTSTGTNARFVADRVWRATASDRRTEAKAAEIFRVPEIGFPMDALEPSLASGNSTWPARTLVRSSPPVIAFASMDAVQKALETAWNVVTFDNEQRAERLNWGSAHVVCLEDMTTCTLRRQPK
jgi:hypothetical protein